MSNVVSTKIENEINYTLEYKVPKKDYEEWRDRLEEQYYSTVEVPGFRKGKAPKNLVEQNINKPALLQTIMRESLEKYTQDALIESQKDLKEKGRVALMPTFSVQPDSVKSEDGFSFTLVAELLPEIDFGFLSKLKVSRPKESDLENRLSLEEFIAKEKKGFISSHNEFEKSEDGKVVDGCQVVLDMSGKIDGKDDPRLSAKDMKAGLGIGQFLPDFEKGVSGMGVGETKTFKVNFPAGYFEASLAGKKAEFTVTVKELSLPKYSTIEEVLTKANHDGHNHSQFADEKSFDEYVKQYYDNETAKLIEDRWQKNVLREVVSGAGDLSVSEERLNQESDRIFGLIKTDSEKQNRDISEIFAISGIPGSSEKIKDEIEMKKIISDYVRNEFKLSSIWNVIYETKIEQKITPEQTDLAAKEVKQNPQKFGLNPNIDDNGAKEFAYSTLMKQISAQWLFDQVREKKKETPTKKETKKK